MKSANLLVSHSWVAKVSDFGTARVVRREGERQSIAVRSHREENTNDDIQLLHPDLLLTRDTGTLLWQAPEIFAMQKYGTSVDVYSYGIVLWEIWCREDPFQDHCFQWISDLSRAVQGDIRPTLPTSAPSSYIQLMEDCWQTNPDARPTFTHIVDHLVDMAGTFDDAQTEGVAASNV
jgi:serine/threonine protein kinase